MAIRNIIPFSIGLEIDGGVFIPLIKMNSQIPIKKRKIFTTIAKDQHTIEIHVLKGEGNKVEENTTIGRFIISNVYCNNGKNPEIEISLSVDKEGLITLDAKAIKQNKQLSVVMSGDTIDEVVKRHHLLLKELKLYDIVTLLVDRITVLKKRINSLLDANLRYEIREILKKANMALYMKDEKELNECKIILETIIVELKTMENEKNVYH